MNRKPVSSSQIAAVGYDPAASVLEVEFNSGSVYQYDGVPPEVAIPMQGLRPGVSIGTYFGASVKDRFPTFKIVDGARVPVAEAMASKKSREFLLSLAKKAGIYDGRTDARIGPAWIPVLEAAGRIVNWPTDMLVDTWLDSLKQVECSAAVNYLKGRTS